LLGNFSLGAQAADDAIKVTSIAQVEIEVTGKDGKKTIKRTPVTKALPGTVVIYTTTFENTIKKAADNININNRIPNDSEYVGAAHSARIAKSCSRWTAARRSATQKI